MLNRQDAVKNDGGWGAVSNKNLGIKKPQQAGVLSDKKDYFLAGAAGAAGAAAAGLASFFSSFLGAGA